MHPETKKN